MISLWMCKNAIYPWSVLDYVKCSKGHKLPYISANDVKEGKPLICKVCQDCADADIMGPNLRTRERGW